MNSCMSLQKRSSERSSERPIQGTPKELKGVNILLRNVSMRFASSINSPTWSESWLSNRTFPTSIPFRNHRNFTVDNVPTKYCLHFKKIIKQQASNLKTKDVLRPQSRILRIPDHQNSLWVERDPHEFTDNNGYMAMNRNWILQNPKSFKNITFWKFSLRQFIHIYYISIRYALYV